MLHNKKENIALKWHLHYRLLFAVNAYIMGMSTYDFLVDQFNPLGMENGHITDGQLSESGVIATRPTGSSLAAR